MICDRTKEEKKLGPLLLSIGLIAIAGCALPRLDPPPTPAPRTLVMPNVLRSPRPSVTLAWTNPPDAALVRNNLYQGGAPGAYTNFTVLDLTESVSLTNVPPGVYFFAVTDTDTNGLESPYSNEVVWTNSVPPPVTNFLLSVQILQSSDFTNWTAITNLPAVLVTNSGAPVYWRALMNIQSQ